MNIPANFTHLHVHSHYSLLGGTASVDALVGRAAADGLGYLALTDSHALYGVVAFARACRTAGIQPIIGMTVATAVPADDVSVEPHAPGQLVLLAGNAAGYRSLCRLSSLIQGHPERETRVRHGPGWDLLKAHREGLICLEGGRMGWLERYLRAGNGPAATRYAARLGGIYQENCYLSVGPHLLKDQVAGSESIKVDGRQIAQEIISLGRRFGLPPVAVQPIYCLEPEDTPMLQLLAAIDHNCALDQVPAWAMPAHGDTDVDLHWRSPQELAEMFAGLPETLAAAGEVAGRCQPSLPDGRPVWPVALLPGRQTPEKALAGQAQAGLAEKYGKAARPVRQRLQGELDAIVAHGFAAFFLVVADIVRFARQAQVPYSTRGSVANSLVAYCLGITTVDPIAHDLVFERFLNPARANLPDIDLDFCSRRRDEVLDYVRRTYGRERVALVATISTMRPKSAIRETAKVYGLDEAQIKKLIERIPHDWHPDPRRRQQHTVDDLLARLDEAQTTDERIVPIIRAAYRILGQPHHLSLHPGGIVITPGPLTDVAPVQWTPKGFLATQFDYVDLEAIGLPKIDLLGIRALTVLADTVELIHTHHEADVSLDNLPRDDAATADLLAHGQTIGVFQCESEGARRTLRQLQARNVRDLAVANAFFKPGPALGGMAPAFVRRYRGEETVTFLHPALEPILGPTQGVLLFQEQILRLAREIAGLSWKEADYLRRGMSKFKAEAMAAMRQRFVTGCQEVSGFTQKQAETLWQQVMPFAGYGFNQGHATAYADVSYRSAYLKAHWPAEFLCARLADAGGFHHPAIYMAEALRLGIDVRPPHVNFSAHKFTLTINNEQFAMNHPQLDFRSPHSPILWMGLGQVRDLRWDSIGAIEAQRPFASLRDLLGRVSLQNKEVTHLVQCGALDGLDGSRAALLAEGEDLARAGSVHQLAFAFGRAAAVVPETLAQRLEWEQRLLGLPVSANPVALVRAKTIDDVPLRNIHRLLNQKTTVAGVRLPGWTGGQGYYVGDGEDFVVTRLAKAVRPASLKPWQPVRLTGYWREDEWGGGWFQCENVEIL